MDVYDEVDRRENDAGELGGHWRPWAAGAENIAAGKGLGPGVTHGFFY